MNIKQLDSYSMLLCSKFLKILNDFINIICVCKKFQETTEKLRFNPISIKSLKLFPKIQTQHLYNEDDIKINGIDKYEIWYKVNYDDYLKCKENIKCHNVIYTREDRNRYENEIPNEVTIISSDCFTYCSSLRSINLPSTLKSLGERCFMNCQLSQ
ncbi:Leucine rich repeat protein bspa family [Entamoeba marina]